MFAFRPGVFLIALVPAVLWPGCSRKADQPVAFNHKLHIYNGVACTVCHVGAETGLRAGLPGVETCRRCHEDLLYESDEEAKIRLAVELDRDLDWIPLTRLAPFVLFSHNRHVTLGKFNCVTCHGDVASWSVPPRVPERNFHGRPGMADCIGCHQESHSRYAGSDCLFCHH